MQLTRRTELSLWLGFLGCLLFLFSPGLFDSQLPAFRDAYHFYYPQAVWLENWAEQGDYFPTWNADEGLGNSVSGQATAALYYPLRVLWLLPWLTLAQRFSLVIVTHLLLAAIGVRWAARKFCFTSGGACLAAFSYALSCPVLFQHTNLIYLCSAAWVGFALGALAGRLGCRRARAVVDCCVFAAACSLMLLAGDPHCAVNALLVAVLLIAVGAWGTRRGRSFYRENWLSRRAIVGGFGWLALAISLIVVATAVQWVPVWRWSQHSPRISAAHESAAIASTDAEPFELRETTPPVLRIALREPSGPHRLFDFSLSPWHLLTWVWPTLGGHYLPHNSRLFDAVPAEARMWLPSLYFGTIPLLCALLALRPERRITLRRRLQRRGLIVIVILALLAALGNYSCVWLLRETFQLVGLQQWADGLPRDHVGSLYWLLAEIVPGYDALRYPAKWNVWATAGLCLLAGHYLSTNLWLRLAAFPRGFRIALFVFTVMLAVVAALLLLGVGESILDRWLSTQAYDSWLGAPSPRAVAHSLCWASIVPIVVWLMLSFAQQGAPKAGLQTSKLGFVSGVPVIIGLTLIEMTSIASGWCSFLPPPHLPTSLATVAEGGQPRVWSNTPAADWNRDRIAEREGSFIEQQAALQSMYALGKLPTAWGYSSLHASQSIEPREMHALRRWLARHDRMTASQPAVDRVLAELGVTHRLVRQERGEPAPQFLWQAIQAPRPLCAWDFEQDELSEIRWKWTAADELEIELGPHGGGWFLVRQYQDGGWRAEAGAELGKGAGQGSELEVADATLFVHVRVTANVHRVRLIRQPFW